MKLQSNSPKVTKYLFSQANYKNLYIFDLMSGQRQSKAV